MKICDADTEEWAVYIEVCLKDEPVAPLVVPIQNCSVKTLKGNLRIPHYPDHLPRDQAQTAIRSRTLPNRNRHHHLTLDDMSCYDRNELPADLATVDRHGDLRAMNIALADAATTTVLAAASSAGKPKKASRELQLLQASHASIKMLQAAVSVGSANTTAPTTANVAESSDSVPSSAERISRSGRKITSTAKMAALRASEPCKVVKASSAKGKQPKRKLIVKLPVSTAATVGPSTSTNAGITKETAPTSDGSAPTPMAKFTAAVNTRMVRLAEDLSEGLSSDELDAAHTLATLKSTTVARENKTREVRMSKWDLWIAELQAQVRGPYVPSIDNDFAPVKTGAHLRKQKGYDAYARTRRIFWEAKSEEQRREVKLTADLATIERARKLEVKLKADPTVKCAPQLSELLGAVLILPEQPVESKEKTQMGRQNAYLQATRWSNPIMDLVAAQDRRRYGGWTETWTEAGNATNRAFARR